MRPKDIVVIFLDKTKKAIFKAVYFTGLDNVDYLIQRMNKPNFPNKTKYPYMCMMEYFDYESHKFDEVQEMIDENVLRIYKTAEVQNTKKNHWIGEIK